jgi:hypothetical protein
MLRLPVAKVKETQEAQLYISLVLVTSFSEEPYTVIQIYYCQLSSELKAACRLFVPRVTLEQQ